MIDNQKQKQSPYKYMRIARNLSYCFCCHNFWSV